MLIVPRTVSKQNNDKEHASRGKPIKYGLSELRGLHSFVLLGDPGAGKSTAFTHEAMEPNCECIKTRSLARQNYIY